MKRIDELKTVKGDAYDYYRSSSEDAKLFESIFLVDEVLEQIYEPSKYFLIGEKGAGKTAYAVYITQKNEQRKRANVILVDSTLYHRFINMKRSKMLELSGIKDIWVVILYLIIAENLKLILREHFFITRRFKLLDKAIQQFYSDAFKPELVNAMEFVENADKSINFVMQQGGVAFGGATEDKRQKSYIEQTYQISLLKLKQVFETAFTELNIKERFILFVDGIDARPAEIENKDYFECMGGLINAVLEINRDILGTKGVKVMPLMRPDVMYRLPIHNLNQKLRDNTVLLDWNTTNKTYADSKLFQIADGYFNKQQDIETKFAECWNHYFPYKINKKNQYENAFVDFLRYSTYKPRDILTMLNEMVSATKGVSFTQEDFKKMLKNYSVYLEGELKDYLLIYMSDIDYTDFRMFFDEFHELIEFDYEMFQKKHINYIRYLGELKREIPHGMETPIEALQLLYDANIIGYCETTEDGRTKYHWTYRERSYANMRPNIPTNKSYMFHFAYANAFGIL